MSILMKALIIRGCVYINRFFFVSFEPYKRGSASVQTTKPVQEPKLGSSLGVFRLANSNENPNFNQVVPVLVQGNALKAFRHRLFHVLYQNVVIVMALIRRLDRCLTPPIKPGRGVFVFVPPN